MQDDLYNQVVHGLTELIRMNLRAVGDQRYSPVPDADRMDEIIKDGRRRADALRELRHQFEDLVNGEDRS